MIDGMGLNQLPTDALDLKIGRLRAPDANSSPDEVRKVAQQLEGVFFSMMVKEMRKSMMSDETFGTGPEAEQYASMFDQMMGEHMAGTGGLGIADMVVRNAEAAARAIRPDELPAKLAEIRAARAHKALEEAGS